MTRSYQRLFAALIVGGALVGCSRAADGAAPGESALRSGPGEACTYTPDEWLTRCPVGMGDNERCRALTGARTEDEREIAALELNLWSSRSGRTARGLGAMHFAIGTRITWSIESVLQLARGPRADTHVLRAVHDANRSFEGCVDHEFVTAWVTTPICGITSGPDRTVSGPASSRCALLDDECRRGRYETTEGCCRQVDLPQGVACGQDDEARDELGCFVHDGPRCGGHDGLVCSGHGQCLAATEIPGGTSAVGPAAWIEAVRTESSWGGPAGPSPEAWNDGQGHIEIRVDQTPIASVPATLEGHRTRVATSLPGQIGVVALDIVDAHPTATRSLFVPLRIPSVLSATEGVIEVCAATGRFDDLGLALADCTGAMLVRCPSEEGALVACSLESDGLARVSAPDLSAAWERVTPAIVAAAGMPGRDDGGTNATDGGTGDIVPLNLQIGPFAHLGIGVLTVPGAYPRGIAGTCGLPAIPCTVSSGSSSSCGGGQPGIRLCAGGHYGTCIPVSTPGRITIESCNGIDDDCDGTVDEGMNTLCGDLYPCTHDTCNGAAGCSSSPNPGDCRTFRLGTLGQAPNRTCESDLCNGFGPVPSGAYRLTPQIVTSGAGNGCQTVLDDGFCTNTWDNCQCNGSEQCSRFSLGADAITGCFAPPRFQSFVTTGPPVVVWHDPCETSTTPSSTFDGDPCTDENICCEANPETCRLTRTGAPASDALTEAGICATIDGNDVYRALAGASHLGTGDGQTARCLDQRLPAGPQPSQLARARICRPDGNWCTNDAITCNSLTGFCNDVITPLANHTSGRTPGAPPAEAITDPWRIAGVTILPGVATPRCDIVEYGCGIAECQDAPFGTSRCTIIAPVEGTAGEQTDDCWGDPIGYYDDDIDQPLSCYELRCNSNGSGRCDELVPYQDRCSIGSYPPFAFAQCPFPVVCAEDADPSALARYPGTTRIGCSPIGGCVVDNQCVPAGTHDLTGCGVCEPASTAVGWTPVENGTSCHLGGAPDVFGRCSLGLCTIVEPR